MPWLRAVLPGLLLSAALGGLAMGLGQLDWLAQHGFSALTLAICLGIVLGNTAGRHVQGAAQPGIVFSKGMLLRAGIVLYGFRLTLQDIAQIGWSGVLSDALVLCSTFALALLLGRRLFGLERNTAMLIGAGSSICGAAAVLATQPVLKAKAEQVTVAVSTVVLFGTVTIFLYPWLYQQQLHWLPSSAAGFGVYAGSTIHEVAQVVAAARAISPETADLAVIAKMVRVMMLAPFLLLLSFWLGHPGAQGGQQGAEAPAITVPWFAFVFVAATALNSAGILPAALVQALLAADTLLLAAAMAALGLSTQLSAVRQAGWRPLLLAALLFIWLIGGGAMLNRVALLLN
ncbi:YeiH family protein [Massilia sp. BJB1822]|uniref:YeiH family protein n=1 Tax=Massilia sp. BJB1822 TaxID=2744470 RepID=UPI001592B148|nr:YeiH family putative sulfate export transporter [Massilia sp. BJB1822]NVD98056.1 YeiH family putative sulfate export transporter [Massilia sp. BJB1822]